LGIDTGHTSEANAFFAGADYIYLSNIQLNYFNLIPTATCTDNVLSPGRYLIYVNTFSKQTYYIIINGIVNTNSFQWNSAMDKNLYESRVSTNGSK
jgi:hypothetical protein